MSLGNKCISFTGFLIRYIYIYISAFTRKVQIEDNYYYRGTRVHVPLTRSLRRRVSLGGNGRRRRIIVDGRAVSAVGVSSGGYSRRVRAERINERRRRWGNGSPSLPGNLVGAHSEAARRSGPAVGGRDGGARCGACIRGGPARRPRKIGVNYTFNSRADAVPRDRRPRP